MIYIRVDVLIFSALVLILTYIHFSKYQKNSNDYTKFLKLTTISLIIVLILETTINILLKILVDDLTVIISKLLLTLSYMLAPFASFMWTIFLIYYLNPKKKNNKLSVLLASLAFIINTLILIWNLIEPVYFDVTLEKGYQRHELFFVFSLCTLYYMFFSIVLVIKEHKNLNFSVFWVLLSFEILPSLGGIIQILFYGTFLTYPFAAIALVLIYMYLKEDIYIIDYVSNAYSNKYLTNFFNDTILQLKIKDYSLAYIDIDNLGKINSEFGEKEGDFILEQFVEIVNRCINEPDFIASNGSDEFIIYFDNNDEDQILNNLKIISRNIEYFNKSSKKPYNINFTFVYYINNSDKISPFKILKTLYYKLTIKKEKMLFKQTYKQYIKNQK